MSSCYNYGVDFGGSTSAFENQTGIGSNSSGGNNFGGNGNDGWVRYGDGFYKDLVTDSRGNQNSIGYVNSQYIHSRVTPSGTSKYWASGRQDIFNDPAHSHFEYDKNGKSIFINHDKGSDGKERTDE
jgi:hypothetical protein